MGDTTNIRDGYIADFTENYMGKLFYFCLKKTGDHAEAEDLAQDVALQITAALCKGTVPMNFPAWVWQIARNRYAVWASDKHERKESLVGDDIDTCEIVSDDADPLDHMIYEEQISALRRELAFIKRDYRAILIAYYIEDQSIRDIALALSLSQTAVKQRLFRARQILKEGMDMAREFGKRSYRPEQIAFVMSGRDGKKGQPWSIIKHLLYKNIFLAANENPQTAEELSLELGIALPYMEDELEFLAQQHLMKKDGDRYVTAFPIISKEEQLKTHEKNKMVQKPLTEKLCALIDLYMSEDGTRVNSSYVGYEAAKWALLPRVFDWFYAKTVDYHSEEFSPWPERPDDGAWVLKGYETIDWQEPPFVGQHGWHSYDENEVNMDLEFFQFKFNYESIADQTPEHLSWKEAYTLWLVCHGKAAECERGYIEQLLAYGYLKREGDAIVPNVVIFDRKAKKPCHEALTRALSALCEEIMALFKEAPAIKRGYVIEQAIENGWLIQDENTPISIGAYIYL